MKRAKDYYSDVFEGIRLAVCGVVLLIACGFRSAVSAVKSRKTGYESGKTTADGNTKDSD